MPLIDYSKIPFNERRSTGEHVKENSFYMPRYEEDPNWYPDGYDAMDFFELGYRRYHEYDTVGYKMEHIIKFDKEGRVIRETEEEND